MKEETSLFLKQTLNLPKTSFSMKANLKLNEERYIEFFQKRGLYQKLQSKKKDRKIPVLHSGPPYANGKIHLGHTLNHLLKDAIVRYSVLSGKKPHFILGWDCHGLPIEHKVSNQLKKKQDDFDLTILRRECQKYAVENLNFQKQDIRRLNLMTDYNTFYQTSTFDYQAHILEMFRLIFQAGYVYRGLRPIHYCIYCQTALAEAEIEFHDHTSPSLIVGFPATIKTEPLQVLIWTTTPWSLPSNVALAFHPEYEYACFDSSRGRVLFAKALKDKLELQLEESFQWVYDISYDDLQDYLSIKHPFIDREVRVVFGDYVSLDTGTGIVHIAPAHGEEDFALCQKYQIPVLMTVDSQGKYNDQFALMKGRFIFDVHEDIIQLLDENKYLWLNQNYIHSYPHCWRCQNPLIYQASSQWFIKLEHKDLRKKLLKIIDHEIQFQEPTFKARMKQMVSNRPDWCVSRQRAWGVPIPAIHCEDCGTDFLDVSVMEKVVQILHREGIEGWFSKSLQEFYTGVCISCQGNHLKKGQDILDVWFDSGCSFAYVSKMLKKEGFESNFPFSYYFEGSDQFRGWFQSSLIISGIIFNQSPYQSLLTHGFVLDEKGKAMSKSLGNILSSKDLINEYGSEVIRLWVYLQDFKNDVKVGQEQLEQARDVYRKIRNTFRFLLGNLYDFNPLQDQKELIEEYSILDIHILKKFQQVKQSFMEALSYHHFMDGLKLVYYFMNEDLSSFYFSILKDVLYTESSHSAFRKVVQNVFYQLVQELALLLGVFLPYTCEEVWKEIFPDDESLYFHSFSLTKSFQDTWDKSKLHLLPSFFFKDREDLFIILEKLKQKKQIKTTLEVQVSLILKEKEHFLFYNQNHLILPILFGVSEVFVSQSTSQIKIKKPLRENILFQKDQWIIVKADSEKCDRCWNYRDLSLFKVGAEVLKICDRCAQILSKKEVS